MKNKTLILLLTVVVTAVGSVSAQVREKKIVKDDTQTVIKHITKMGDESIVTKQIVLPKRIDKHDIRVGVGSLGLMTSLFLDDWGCSGDLDLAATSFNTSLKNADTYSTPRWFVGIYSLSYTYHHFRWLQYGATVSFGASTCKTRHTLTNEVLENNNLYMLSVMPTVRFIWYWREKVQLYSSVSLGVMTDMYEILPWGDVTLVGCSFGRKFFGFTEVGFGASGIFRIGMGYRFDAAGKNKK